LITETRIHQVEPGITVLEISGRLNVGELLQSIESTVRGLIDGGVRKLVIDLTGLNSIGSSGIGMLVSLTWQMDRKGGHLRLAGAQASVAKALDMVHMQRIVPLHPDLTSACESLRATSG
jgi:anti-anti-sigma factor